MFSGWASIGLPPSARWRCKRNGTAAGLMYVMRYRTKMHPVPGLNDRQEFLAFFHGEYREVQRLVRRLRVRGTENSYNSHASSIAAERECNNSICGCNPLPKAQNVYPPAVPHNMEDLG